MSPTLVGGFLSTAPPGKSSKRLKLFLNWMFSINQAFLLKALLGIIITLLGTLFLFIKVK